ncbi:MAG: enoyl-CoA hydratase/isomerase family protein [Rhizobiaceae bacterium]
MTHGDDILFEHRGRAGIVTLNKPETLNAVTDGMLSALNAQLDLWETDARVERIIIKAVEGRAFSAGGDIRHLYECGIAKNYDFDFFAREYQLNARIAQFPKPYIALINGIAMGGGVGVSFHGSHRVAGDNIAFAMPEVGIGFFPDVGASHFLSRLPGRVGLYLGLTGDRIKQNDVVWSGLASHGCPSEQLAELEAALCETEDLEAVLAQFHSAFSQAGGGSGPVEQTRGWIDLHFSGSSVSEILTSLKIAAEVGDSGSGGAGSDDAGAERSWAQKTLETLEQKSPTSLEIAFRQITNGADLDIVGCMKMEYRILKRILVGTEFYEGIRAAIIDKDRSPKWQPATLSEVDAASIAANFDDLGSEELAVS